MKYLKSYVHFMWMLVALTPAYVNAKEITFGTYMPGTHQSTMNTVKFGEALANHTDGDLTLSVLSGGSIASGKATLSVISDGLIDAGLVTDVYVPGDFPHTVIASSLALRGESPWVMAGAMAEYAMTDCNGCREDLDKLGVLNLGHHSTGTYMLLCNAKISSVADLKGKKIKAAGPWTRLVASWGAAPVNIPFNDVYEGLQRGQLDCALAPESAIEDYGLYDVLSHVVDFPMGTYHGYHSFVFNKDAWESLTEEQRAFVLKEIPSFVAENIAGYFDSSRKSKAKAIEKGIKYVEVSDDIRESFEKAKIEEKEIALTNAAKRGVKNPEENVNTFLKAVDKWTAIIGDDEPSAAEFSRMLIDEVYSKAQF